MKKLSAQTNKKLSAHWLKNIRDPKKREDAEKTILNSTIALGRLREILEDFEQEVLKEEVSEENYDKASWAYLQAHRNGKKQALRTIKKLTDHLEE